MKIKEATTTELRVLAEKIQFELSQRKDEVELPVVQINGADVRLQFTERMIDQTANRDLILSQIDDAFMEKNRAFNITIQMIPESDHKQLEEEL